jgi:tetratricopeptide (TPR) repeat protein
MLERLRATPEVVVVGIAAVRAAANFRNPAAAEAIARLLITPDRPDPWRAAGRILVAQGALMRGEWDAAQALLDSAAVIEPAWALEIGALGALLPDSERGPEELRRLRSELEAWDPARDTPELAFFFATHADAHAQLRLYLLAFLSVRLRDDAAADRYTRELRAAGQTREGKELGAALFNSVAAERAARDGDREQALRLLDEVPLRAPLERIALSPFFARSLDRWRRAELLEALGRHDDALRWYRSLTDGPDLLFWAPAHRRQAELLTRLGRTDEAARHRALFQAIRPAAVPEP